jgi:hypothetical protein
MSRGIVGSYETRKPGIDYPCMIGDIEKTAGLTVYEPDDGLVQFAKWRPLDQNAPSRSAASAPAREDQVAGRGSSRRRDRTFYRCGVGPLTGSGPGTRGECGYRATGPVPAPPVVLSRGRRELRPDVLTLPRST